MTKHKKLYITLGILVTVFVVALSFFAIKLRFDAYLPHEKIQIILPFDAQYDKATSLIPMGETIYHPKPMAPMGHPGIDFGSQIAYPFIASADGTISKILKGASSDGSDVYLDSGAYSIVYKEMDSNHIFVTVGQKVKQGDKIAMPDPKVDPARANDPNGNVHYSTHWEFASASPIRDRYCPLTYFTSESRTRIETIWVSVKPTDNGGVKQQFPYICSGDYYNRVE